MIFPYRIPVASLIYAYGKLRHWIRWIAAYNIVTGVDCTSETLHTRMSCGHETCDMVDGFTLTSEPVLLFYTSTPEVSCEHAHKPPSVSVAPIGRFVSTQPAAMRFIITIFTFDFRSLTTDYEYLKK